MSNIDWTRATKYFLLMPENGSPTPHLVEDQGVQRVDEQRPETIEALLCLQSFSHQIIKNWNQEALRFS